MCTAERVQIVTVGRPEKDSIFFFFGEGNVTKLAIEQEYKEKES